MTEFATWTGEPPEAVAEDAPQTPGAASWLPASVQRSIAREEAAERAAKKKAKAEHEQREQEWTDKNLKMYREQAEQRGEQVSAVAIARGEDIGRPLADVLAGATGELADRIPKGERGERNYELLDAGEPVIRSRHYDDGWPSSSYEADRQLRQADELHRDRVAYEARQASSQGRAAEHIEAERTRAQRNHQGDAHRSQPEISRYLPAPPCDRCGHVRCQCR